ncbi:MAG: acyl-CoA dehydrogenase family protein [Actinomycetota bacterium]
MGPELDEFRHQAAEFIAEAQRAGVACPAYGAILAPNIVEPARRWQAHCADHGFAGIHWPTAYGGAGLTPAHTGVWAEECARADVAPYLNLQGIVLAAGALLRYGTEEQKASLLPPTLTGELIWCQLFSEPGAGSDLAGLATRAVPTDDGFVVDGQKVWSSNAELAGYAILLARTTDERAAHRGLSFFCYDMTLAGTEVRPLRQMTGDAEFSEVFLTDVAMPADALLGDLHDGWRVAMSVLEDERGSLGASQAIGLARRLTALGVLASAGGAAGRDRAADLLVRGRALEQLLYRCEGDATRAPMSKLLRSELDSRAVGAELDARGAGAMITDELTDRFLYAPGMRIAGGSSEIQRNIVGERLLGLPREPKPPK